MRRLEERSRCQVELLSDYAGDIGMTTSMLIWGQILFQPLKIYCPSDPKERLVTETGGRSRDVMGGIRAHGGGRLR